MNKKDKHSKTEESALFRDAIGQVDPVKTRRKASQRPQPKPHAKFSRADDQAVLEESLMMDADIAEVETGEELVFARPDITKKVMRQLRRGQYAIQDEIDLHGMTLDEARPALHDFLRECLADHCHCVRVVHGKGRGSGPRGPVLKNAVNRWLRRWDAVAAFCSAQPHHGGTGAVYVILRKYIK